MTIILAAGQGSRLRSVTDKPKCLLKVGDRTIIERILDGISENRVTIVVGYKSEEIERFLGKEYEDIKIKYIENKLWKETNNSYSLALARNDLIMGSTILESDVVCDEFDLKEDKWLVVPWKEEMDGCRLEGDPIKKIEIIRRQIQGQQKLSSDENKMFKSCGCLKLSRESGRTLVEELRGSDSSSYYDQILARCLDKLNIRPRIFEGKWIEVDTPEDLLKAKEMFE